MIQDNEVGDLLQKGRLRVKGRLVDEIKMF
jgi:hypothetical protein